ncbi:alpha/beta hydrolase [Streptacidiphilus carbonis]|uniref:alpha/beta hydrolase n=1 Tax=Streptacidiphilus carbonis TaxID=105422 RepID=UPI0005AA1013|nr:alpha/beta hydrolase [Streptacidiphilus carbonis]
MTVSVRRETVRFASGSTECAALHYPGTNGGCVIMAGGTAVTKGPASDRFAQRFNAAGFAVLAFDFRRFGGSGGSPRQVVDIGEQLADWQAAIGFAAALPDVDPAAVSLWGFSLAGGEVFEVAAANPQLASVIAQTPLADGRAAAPNALRNMTLPALLRLTGLAVADGLGALIGREPLLVPAAGHRGEVASLTTPDAMDGTRALDPDGVHTDWDQRVAARIALQVGFYRPGLKADQVTCPLLVLVCDQDQSVLTEPGVQAAGRAPRGEVVRVSGRHYAPFLESHEQAVEAELSFLLRHLPEPTA